MITKYKHFYNDSILDNMINESRFIMSDDIKNILNKLSYNKIANKLLSINDSDILPDITFIEIDNINNVKDGYLLFRTMSNIEKISKKEFGEHTTKDIIDIICNKPSIYKSHTDDYNRKEYLEKIFKSDIYNKSKTLIKFGRLINKLFPGEFKDKEVEEFINLFKANIYSDEYQFSLIDGGEIAYWYNLNSYFDKNKGQLGSSCMKNANSDFFDIYTKNPEVCKMLILTNNDKLIGRALVWKVTGLPYNVKYFMDKPYTTNDHDINKFKDYAIRNKWAYRTYTNNKNIEAVSLNGISINIVMNVQLNKNIKYEFYPFMDTFRKYNPEKFILSNEKSPGGYLLDSMIGSFTDQTKLF